MTQTRPKQDKTKPQPKQGNKKENKYLCQYVLQTQCVGVCRFLEPSDTSNGGVPGSVTSIYLSTDLSTHITAMTTGGGQTAGPDSYLPPSGARLRKGFPLPQQAAKWPFTVWPNFWDFFPTGIPDPPLPPEIQY